MCSTVCFVQGLFYFKLKLIVLQLLCHLVVPVTIAFGLYWIPYLKKWDNPEYHGWDLIFVLMVTIFAIPASIVAALLSKYVRKTISQPTPAGDAATRAPEE